MTGREGGEGPHNKVHLAAVPGSRSALGMTVYEFTEAMRLAGPKVETVKSALREWESFLRELEIVRAELRKWRDCNAGQSVPPHV